MFKVNVTITGKQTISKEAKNGKEYTVMEIKYKQDGEDKERSISIFENKLLENQTLNHSVAELRVGDNVQLHLDKQGNFWVLNSIGPAGEVGSKSEKHFTKSTKANPKTSNNDYKSNMTGQQVGHAITSALKYFELTDELSGESTRDTDMESILLVAKRILEIGNKLRKELEKDE